MLKKSTLLSVSIFVLLFIGLSDYGYGCHKDFDGIEGNDPHGNQGPCPPPDGPGNNPGNDKVVGEYAVTIDDYPTNFPWLGHANEKSVDGNNLPGLIDLPFFVAQFPDEDADGVTEGDHCFLSLDQPLVGFGGVQRKPGDTAWGRFWFPGCTTDGLDAGGVDCVQEVLYQLIIFGDFADGFSVLPLNPGDSALMVMPDWMLQISGGGLNIQMDSCLAESEVASDAVPEPEFPQFIPPVEILVERCPGDVGGLCP